MLRHAFKEWAVICRALAEGRQAIILRKGGIAEAGGSFQVEHDRFWLYPTYLHQQRAGVRADAVPLLERAEAEKPPPGTVRLSHTAEIPCVYEVHKLDEALALEGLHLWSQETIEARFAYRRPGLFVLPARVYRAAQSVYLPETAAYAGCRSWVELEREMPTEGATPVLSDEHFRDVLRELDRRLRPTAQA